MSAVAIAAVAMLFRPLLLSSLSSELAEARGVSSRRMELCFLIILAFATSISVPVVGALLVFSLMVGPAAGARALTDRPQLAIFLSIGIALITVWIRLPSDVLNWPVGFFVGSIGVLVLVRDGAYTPIMAMGPSNGRRARDDTGSGFADHGA